MLGHDHPGHLVLVVQNQLTHVEHDRRALVQRDLGPLLLAGLIASIPMGFKTIGFDTHAKFDSIANSAEKNFDPKVTQQQVTALLGNCVACHRSYRMDVKKD